MKDTESIEAFSLKTWGVAFRSLCSIPGGWRIKAGSELIRVRVQPDGGNGLKQPGEIAADLIVTMRKTRIDAVVGAVAPDVMGRVDEALRRLLGL